MGFKMESEVLAGLSHPHLLRIVASSVNGRGRLKYALVMELMQEDLSESNYGSTFNPYCTRSYASGGTRIEILAQ